MKEIQINSFVYVIALEQPWVNFFGIVTAIDSNQITVENEDGLHVVHSKQVSLALED